MPKTTFGAGVWQAVFNMAHAFCTINLSLGVFNLIVKKIEKKNAAKEAQAA